MSLHRSAIAALATIVMAGASARAVDPWDDGPRAKAAKAKSKAKAEPAPASEPAPAPTKVEEPAEPTREPDPKPESAADAEADAAESETEEKAGEPPAPASAAPAAAPAAPAPAAAPGDDALHLARDLQTPSPGGAGRARAMLVDTPEFRLALRGFSHFVAAPYVGTDALVAAGDIGDFAGMRVRRLQLGAEGHAGKAVSFGLWIDLADSNPLLQARLAYTVVPELSVETGVLKIPFSRSALQSSAELSFGERPLAVDRLVPDRQPGIAAYGAFFGGRGSYRFGVFNGAEVSRAARGNDHPGALLAARVGVSPLGPLRPGQADLERGPIRVELAASALYDKAAGFEGVAYGADLSAQGYGASLLLEYVRDERKPLSEPVLPPTLASSVVRTGLVAQAGYLIWKDGIELVARAERVDDNTSLEDVGDVVASAVGAHWYASGLDLRLGLDWYHRVELAGPELDNDSIVLGTQGRF